MKLHNLFALLFVILVSVSVVSAQTETKKTDPAKEKKSCCPDDKSTKSGVKSDNKSSDCTNVATTHKHGGKSNSINKETTSKSPMYACPMHPDVTSDKPGKCLKCGMNLEKTIIPKAESKLEIKSEMYVCPMHPEEKSDKPSKCSKCGMNLEKIK